MESPVNHQVLNVSPNDLLVHPKLASIYGEYENRSQLEESIRLTGIKTPLEVSLRTGEQIVLSGKCRLQIALNIGLEFVPVVIRSYVSSREELDAILMFNLHREEKTHYQKLVEGDYLESVLRPLAQERQREGARIARSSQLFIKLSKNVHFATSESERINVAEIVSKSIKLSQGSYSKGKKVFNAISQMEYSRQLRAATGLKEELNRSINSAYKFLGYSQKNKVIKTLEQGDVKTLPEAMAMVNSGYPNPWHKYDVGQVYLFNKKPRSDFYHQGRVSKITDDFVYFSFRNTKTNLIETIALRPDKINALVCEEPSALERERINRLLSKFGGVYPIRLGLLGLLDVVNFTLEEKKYLADLEAGGCEQVVGEGESSFSDSDKNCVDFRGQSVPLGTNFVLA